MLPMLDYEDAKRRLMEALELVQGRMGAGDLLQTGPVLRDHLDLLFKSKTQAFREGLVGCVLARLCDPKINASKPYVKHGEGAYNGRTLDEKVVNPMLTEWRIPVSRAPFLSTLRRGVQFTEDMGVGVRDQSSFKAFIAVVNYINQAEQIDLNEVLHALAHRFLLLRDASNIPVHRLQRISHEQYATLISGLLNIPSGGRFPVFLAEATFRAISEAFDLNWEILVQGINVADGPAKASGDLEIRFEGRIILAAEITERVVDKHRIQSTFQTKIAVANINDYLFLVTTDPDDEAVAQARQYFSQGHEVNFVDIKAYILATLLSIGVEGRACFNRVLVGQIDQQGIPAMLKVAWNKQIAQLTAI